MRYIYTHTDTEECLRCKITDRSRGPTFVSRISLVWPRFECLRACVLARARIRGSVLGRLVGAGETVGRGGMRETFSSVPTARRFPSALHLSRIYVALCRAHRRARAISYTYTRARARTLDTYTRALSHHRKTVALALGRLVGRAATPVDRLRCCETRQRAISGPPVSVQRREKGGVLLSLSLSLSLSLYVYIYIYIYICVCACVRACMHACSRSNLPSSFEWVYVATCAVYIRCDRRTADCQAKERKTDENDDSSVPFYFFLVDFGVCQR